MRPHRGRGRRKRARVAVALRERRSGDRPADRGVRVIESEPELVRAVDFLGEEVAHGRTLFGDVTVTDAWRNENAVSIAEPKLVLRRPLVAQVDERHEDESYGHVAEVRLPEVEVHAAQGTRVRGRDEHLPHLEWLRGSAPQLAQRAARIG